MTGFISDCHSWSEDAPLWIRLRSRDALASALFYGQVLDWACGQPGCCDVGYENDEEVLARGEKVEARLGSGADEAVPHLASRNGTSASLPPPRGPLCRRRFGTAEPSRTKGRQRLLIWGDLCDPDFCKHAVDTTVQSLGGLNILASNAARLNSQNTLEDLNSEDFGLAFKADVSPTPRLITSPETR